MNDNWKDIAESHVETMSETFRVLRISNDGVGASELTQLDGSWSHSINIPPDCVIVVNGVQINLALINKLACGDTRIPEPELEASLENQNCHIKNCEDQIVRQRRKIAHLLGGLRSCYNSAKTFLEGDTE